MWALKKVKSIAVISVFSLLLLGFVLLLLLTPDKEYSAAERRILSSPPPLTAGAVFGGEYSVDAEKYLLDQFPFRDALRSIKAYMRLKIFRQLDSNGLYVRDGAIYKNPEPFKEEQIIYAAEKIDELSGKFFSSSRVYYSVIPDKNYFADARGYPRFDYARQLKLMGECVSSAVYIDIFPMLSLDAFYRTDTHWTQEKILPVADALLAGMESDYRASADSLEENQLYPFYGVYSGQLALPVKPDTLIYLSSPAISACAAEYLGKETRGAVYCPEEFSGADSYDVFLSGAEPLITLENPAVTTGRRLIIFRDSFGSSLAPLLLGGYGEITLVDLRYFSSSLLADYIDPKNADVLFIYSSAILNNGMLLK